MEIFLAIICVLSFIAFVVGMIKPKAVLFGIIPPKRKFVALIYVVLFFVSAGIGSSLYPVIQTEKEIPIKEAEDKEDKEQVVKTPTRYELGISAFFNADYKEAKKHLNKLKSCDTCFYNPQAILSIIEWRTTKDKEEYISKRLLNKWYSIMSVSEELAPNEIIGRHSLTYTNKGDKVFSDEYFADGKLIAISYNDNNTSGSSHNYRYIVNGTTIEVILSLAREKRTVEYISENLMITKSEEFGTVYSYYIDPNNEPTATQELITLSRIATANIESKLERVSNLITAKKYIDASSDILSCQSTIAFRGAVDPSFNSQEINNLIAKMQKSIMPEIEAEYIERYDSLSKPLLTKLETNYDKGATLESLSNIVQECNSIVVSLGNMEYNATKLKQFNNSLSTTFNKKMQEFELYGDGDRDGIIRWAETEAKTILREHAKDPSSVKIEKVVCDGKVKNGWKCRVQYRAKNSFGGYEREVVTVVMQYDISHKAYKCVSYSL